VRLDIKINGEDAPPLALICHKEQAHGIGRSMTEKLKELIPRQMIVVKIQACIGVKPVASSQVLKTLGEYRRAFVVVYVYGLCLHNNFL